MPRGPRLDTIGALHHVMARGIEGKAIFETDEDHGKFVTRLGTVITETGTILYAWVLMPNHFHLLIRTGRTPLSGVMRRLLTGYAMTFNLANRRQGHLFQNRYKSVLVEDEPYLLELVRYIHLNPVRAGLARDLKGLEEYRWSGHLVLMGKSQIAWQETKEILGRFGTNCKVARKRYHEFVADGMVMGVRPELAGGRLFRSPRGLDVHKEARRERERGAHDGRILGCGEFVEQVLKEARKETEQREEVKMKWSGEKVSKIVARVANLMDLKEAEILGGGRRKALVEARAVVSYISAREMGLPAIRVARELNISQQTVLRGLEKGKKILGDKSWSIDQVMGQ